MGDISITHREGGRGFNLILEDVGETIPLSAGDLLAIHAWCRRHREELEVESQEIDNERAFRLLAE